MAARLGVSPSRILLLFGETELSPTATPRTLKLGVADILGERKAGGGASRLLSQGGAKGKGAGGARLPVNPSLGLASRSCLLQTVWC